MASVCKSLQNTAGAPCSEVIRTAKRIILVPEKDASGDKNELANVAAVTKSALQTLFDSVEAQDRYYPLSPMKNASNVRAETEFFEYEGGGKTRIREGARTLVAWLPWESTITLKNLKYWQGQKFGVFIIDKDGNFRYYTDSSTELKVQPMMVDGESVDFMYMEATESDPAYIKVEFDFADSMADEYLRYIPYADLDFDGRDETDVYGLTDVEITKGVTYSETTLIFSIATIFGIDVIGLLLADIEVYNVTDSAVLTPDSLTESGSVPGSYTADMTTEQGAGNIVTGESIRVKLTKSTYNRNTLTDTVT